MQCMAAGMKNHSAMPGVPVPFNGEKVSIALNKEKLSVTATRAGGTLIWNGKEYSLIPNQPQVINVIPQTNSPL